MVTICGKKFSNTREKLLLSGLKEKKQNKNFEEFLENLKQRREHRVLSGTAIPNSTYRSISSIDHLNQEKSVDLPSPGTSEEAKNDQEPVRGSNKRSSILSGTGTLEELKELKDLLHQSSYIPKKPATRRSTIEKIRSAIEKEKQTIKEEENEQSETDDESPELSDASMSTITVKKTKKKTKTRKNSIVKKANPRSDTSTTKNLKKNGGKVKKTCGKIDAQIQCSIKLKR